MSENGSWGADSANCKILSFLFFSMGDWKVHPIWFFAFGQVVMMMIMMIMMMMSKVTNRTDDIIGWVSLMWSLFFRGTFDVEFVLSGAQFWMWSFFFLGGGGGGRGEFDVEFGFLGPSLMWSLVFWGLVWCGVCFFWGPVWCGVCFYWGTVWYGVCYFLGRSLLFFGPQFDVEFVFLGDQFDVEFFFLGPSLMWSFFILGRGLMWSLCFGRQFEGSLSGATGILAQGIKSRTQIFCRIHSHFRLTVEHFLRACLPACVPDSFTHSLTHSLSHAWRKQGCTWQSPSERAWLPGRGTWEKDYAEPNWRIRTCAFSRGSRCPMMIMMMSAAIHCSILHTHNNIYIYKQMRIWFLAIISYSCASDSEQKLLSSSSCLLPCLLARLPAAHLSFCK